MDHININNIFGKGRTDLFRPIDVKSLCEAEMQYNKKQDKISFNIDKLIDQHEEKKKKIIDQYIKMLNICLKKIKLASSLNQTQIIHEVPKAIFMYPKYNSFDCMLFIKDKLEKMYIDAVILSDNTIYITWEYVKHNKSK